MVDPLDYYVGPPCAQKLRTSCAFVQFQKFQTVAENQKFEVKNFKSRPNFQKKILKSHDFVENTEQTRTSESAVDAQASNLRRV